MAVVISISHSSGTFILDKSCDGVHIFLFLNRSLVIVCVLLCVMHVGGNLAGTAVSC